MPEIEILRVFHWLGIQPHYSIEDAARDTITDELEPAEFGLVELVELGKEYGVTRWSEATDAERKEFEEVSYVADRLLLIGWAEAPIARDDVQRSYHSNYSNRDSRPPMVNIKVYNTNLPKGEAFADLVSEFELDPKLALLGINDLRDLIEQFVEKEGNSSIFYNACESNFDDARADAISDFFPDHNIRVWQEGRSGGWLVVEGLPDVDSWGPELLTKWHEFERRCADLVADIPRAMAWQVLANFQDELAGRIVRVELMLTLSDADLDEVGDDPTEWDWETMLDLGVDSTINVKHLP